MRHALAILASLRSHQSLEEALFATSVATVEAMVDGEIVCEDDFADTYGMLVSHLLAARLRRLLHITDGWPWSLARLLQTSHAAEAVRGFESSVVAFRALAAAEPKSGAAQRLYERRQLQKPSNKAYIDAMAHRSEPAWDEGIALVTKTRLRVACQTQMIEDMNGAQQNARGLRSIVRFRRPERAMASVLKKKITSERHRWLELLVDSAEASRSDRLGQEYFVEDIGARSLPWGQIVSTTPSTSYYSPKAENITVNVADDVLVKHLHAMGDFNRCEDSWVGCLANVRHKILLGLKEADGSVAWHHGLFHFDRSAVLTWPGRLVKVAGTALMYFQHSDAVARPSLRPLTSLADLQACTFEWRSFAWQVRTLPKGTATVGMLPFIEEGPMGAVELAARCAFWSMDRGTVLSFAASRGIVVDDAASLAEVLFSVVQRVLLISDEAAVKILEKRLTLNDLTNTFADVFLEIDVAHEVLDRADASDLIQEQKEMQRVAQDDAAFRKSFRHKQEQLNKGKGRGAKTGKGEGKLAARYAAPSTIPQAQAREFAPEGTHIWRGVVRSEWCGHCPPHRRAAASWLVFGEQQALRVVLQRLWDQWLGLRGLDRSACPYDGLWDEAVAAQPAAAAAGAS